MKLGTLDLPNATITIIAPTKKVTVYQYLWTDDNYVEESGLGLRGIEVTGMVTSLADRDAVEQACESTGVKHLYFPSINGADDDRFYHVYTTPAQFTPMTGTVYSYSFSCTCADPSVYDATTELAIW